MSNSQDLSPHNDMGIEVTQKGPKKITMVQKILSDTRKTHVHVGFLPAKGGKDIDITKDERYPIDIPQGTKQVVVRNNGPNTITVIWV